VNERITHITFKEERMTRAVMVTWTVAVALSAFACGSNDSNTNNKFPAGDATKAGEPTPGATAGTSGAAASTTANDKSPMTITGCLQKGDGRNDYILTEVSTPRTKVGTSGSTPPETGSSADVVGKEQMRAAAHAYNLNGNRDALEPLVGKQVRITGTLVARADLKDKDRDRAKIDDDDLAKVDVTSVEALAGSCGGKSQK